MSHFKRLLSSKYNLILYIFSIFFISSCSNIKKVTYFGNIPDSLSGTYAIQKTPYQEPKIQPGNLLNISIQTLDPRAVAMITGSNATNGPASTDAQNIPATAGVGGYVVDTKGFVELPLVGRVKLAGLTITQARDTLHNRAQQFYNDPIINIRPNFAISVYGDVGRPGTYLIPSDKVSVLDAISTAGDLTITAKRENILLLRERGDSVYASRYDLNSSDIFSNPNYYLMSGDKIYVEPNKARKKLATADLTKDRYFSYTISLLSLFIALASLYKP
jgi:polysaccharide export outer membrane protein